jgi:hypothetical protein
LDARRLSIALVSAVTFRARGASAQEAPPPDALPVALPVAFRADDVSFDGRSQALNASGHVVVDEPPFHLTSDALRLRRVPIGAELEGQGKLVFCPCLGSPIAVRFSGATMAPPDDVILRDPVLEVFGLPVAWAPAFWLRSPGRFGLLPPELAWRGSDGLFAGGGIHVPWIKGDVAHGVDLHAGGYVDGGVAVSTSIRTTTTETRVAWDRLHGDDGVGIAARGATAIAYGARADSVAWNVDALRGERAVKATTDLEAAARPFDRAHGQVAWRPDGWTVASGVRTTALRGGDLLDLGVGGPIVVVRRADAVAHAGTYDATFEGGQVAGAGLGATSFARAEGGALFVAAMGALGSSVALRALGDVADDGARSGTDGAAQARASVSLPLARSYASGDDEDPWKHRTEPRVEVAAVATHAGGVLVTPAGRGMNVPSGVAWIAGGGWSNAIARWGSRAAAELDAAAGAIGNDRIAYPAMRARAAVSGPWVALFGDFGRVVLSPGGEGGALVAGARIGPSQGLHVSAHVAERDGVDPVLARALADAPLEPASGFLAAEGWTGGARLGVPLGARVTTRAGADVDLLTRELVAAVGSLELHDPCNCVVVRASAAHRIGREGVDVWVSVDLPMAEH